MWNTFYKIYSAVVLFGLFMIGLLDYSINGTALAVYSLWLMCIRYYPEKVWAGIKQLFKIR